MIYKHDMDTAMEKMTLWWQGRLKEPALHIFCPKDPIHHTGFDIWAFIRRQKSPEQILHDFDLYCRNNDFLGEQLPVLWINLGPGIQAAYYTDFLSFDFDTCWFEVRKDWEEVLKMKFLEQGYWWNFTKECFQKAADENDGIFIIGMTDIGGVTDILASLRGAQNLLIDLVEEPDRVKIMQDAILQDWFRIYFELDSILKNKQQGKSAWMGIWSPDDWYPLQCDFSAMISPEMFEEFVLPHLKMQTEKFPFSIYHLDGPGQIPHLDMLLQLKKLTAVQWVPGAGAPDYDDKAWDKVYKKIFDSGKRLVLSGVPFGKIETILDNLGTENILITSWCTDKNEAERILKKYKKM